MEVLKDSKIKEWLDVGISVDCRNNDGFGNGYGGGCICGRRSGCGITYGYCYYPGSNFGDGCYNGDGEGSGAGCGYGGGHGIMEYDGDKVYSVDNIPTIIVSIHGSVARGFVLFRNTRKYPCFIVKGDGCFAHGETIRSAFYSLREKQNVMSEEERIAVFIKRFPSYDAPYLNADLFHYHNILTGSCRMGREYFCKAHGIDMDGQTTVREFVELTKNSYGGQIISRLAELYNKNK